ncbi:MAG: sigma-54 dependent transcriptional regulator [Pseudomonadota bacterium]
MSVLHIPSQKGGRPFSDFVVVSEAMRSILTTVDQVAPYRATVLITGESGTGKELLAQIIHLRSGRAEGPFIAMNCGTLSGQLFEDKLFGHEEGAFTGAVKTQPGRFEMADGGTLFLDEVSELTPENQLDFLRVLESGELRRIGGKSLLQVDVRVIAASNRPLADMVSEGTFRQDLFYRLHVIPLHVPPLRERAEAVPHLIEYFLGQFSSLYQKPRISFTPEAVKVLTTYRWPGNVRELRNMVERVFVLNRTGVVGVEDLPAECRQHGGGHQGSNLKNLCHSTEHRAIIDALERFNGNRDKVAAFLGISPRTLRYKLSRFEISFRRGGRGGRATSQTPGR